MLRQSLNLSPNKEIEPLCSECTRTGGIWHFLSVTWMHVTYLDFDKGGGSKMEIRWEKLDDEGAKRPSIKQPKAGRGGGVWGGGCSPSPVGRDLGRRCAPLQNFFCFYNTTWMRFKLFSSTFQPMGDWYQFCWFITGLEWLRWLK